MISLGFEDHEELSEHSSQNGSMQENLSLGDIDEDHGD